MKKEEEKKKNNYIKKPINFPKDTVSRIVKVLLDD